MPSEITKIDEGTYEAKYKALNLKTGHYHMDAKVDDQLIGKYYIKCVEGSSTMKISCEADVRRCFVKGPSLEELFVFLVDYNGKPTDGMCVVSLKGPDGSDFDVKTSEVAPGTYRAKYDPLNSVTGGYIMGVEVDYQKIRKFQITTVEGSSDFTVKCLANARGSSIENPGLEQVT